MARIGELDLVDRLAPILPAIVTQIGFGLACSGGAILARIATDILAPGAGPFALAYPAILLATLFARWPSGAITGLMSVLYAWYFVLPVHQSFAFADPADGPRLLVNIAASAIIIWVAELFRRAVRRATEERDRQIADRDLFLEEFDHRVKNNFALVSSLLQLQRRRAEPATAEALDSAIMRVDSIARAHRHLYRGGDQPGAVQIRDYLAELCAALGDVLAMRGGIELACSSDDVLLPRDRAVSIGLIVNELVTNAAKHAFTGREAGKIAVSFTAVAEGWRLVVADNGVGMPTAPRPTAVADGGLGTKLVDAFVRQADGTIMVDSDATGTAVTLLLAA